MTKFTLYLSRVIFYFFPPIFKGLATGLAFRSVCLYRLFYYTVYNPCSDAVSECFASFEKKYWIFRETFTIFRELDEKTGNRNLFKKIKQFRARWMWFLR